ncbi:23S rRNA (adenine2503-C2)-methyltransferase [Peptoclostridium litorale DSM 5388]|uniref:Probable dual-specificity RNA methyltransferase RlmN n=1 Tax=Peptoclostridium litorale DSM 5388 TaxID=1121324 RepID=A0A069RB69_PEPLI|nr:23S rRNA (adenine(2503)-C(2))-methyltransferase RlmN [Peptoclostridium litorale]KDR94033.1 putative dual-specificity RNA methyltransferase RlmN [Peptoclostridium litorale DSM 5388]SIN79915.1 23S rRNA (adenine2503-C2)-methyltransferase [Peptoclostridium litorale DSM 5388]
MEKVDIKSFTEEQLRGYIETIGEKSFRGSQVFKWIYKGIKDFDDMNNIPAPLRQKLAQNAYIDNIQIDKKLVSKIDQTRKYLFRLMDGNIIESVMMKYKHGVSACISTQVGCRMGCSFCASTVDGMERNLTASEMLDQIIGIQEDTGERVSNVVMMGSGEPLDNFEETVKFLRAVNDKNGLNIGYRHITLSTCGIVPKIYDLADMEIPINLAISLHAVDDTSRKRIMPIAKAYSIEEVLDACRYYVEKTNRRITFEYAIIQGVNDSEKEALALSKLLKGILSHVNIIPVNKIDEKDYKRPSKEGVERFSGILSKHGINATVRREMGSDINGACGQLRKRNISG